MKNILPDYFSVSNQVKANVLIVEGWLPPYAIEMAANIFETGEYDIIVATGIKPSDFFMMPMNGYLIFYTHNALKDSALTDCHLITAEAYGEMSRNNASHFKIFINDSLAGDFTATKHRKKYSLEYKGKLSDIDSIMVQFDNDKHGDFGDRNLYVSKIIIDQKTEIPYQNNSVYDIGLPDGKSKMANNFDSFALLAKKRLMLLNIDSSYIISLPGKDVKINRTISSALAFNKWIDTTRMNVEGINIVTLGFHARRTLITYKHFLDNKIEIGIISLPDYKSRYSKKSKYYKFFHELVGLLYYFLILRFY